MRQSSEIRTNRNLKSGGNCNTHRIFCFLFVSVPFTGQFSVFVYLKNLCQGALESIALMIHIDVIVLRKFCVVLFGSNSYLNLTFQNTKVGQSKFRTYNQLWY